MQNVNEIIKDILNTPLAKDMTLNEAQKKLRDCGILDQNNKIAEAYRSIISNYPNDKLIASKDIFCQELIEF